MSGGLTQAHLAERMGVTASYISNLENGRENITVGQLWAVALALRVELRIEFPEPVTQEIPIIPPPPTTGG